MSQLMGADTRRIDLISDGLDRYSQDVLNLRGMAARAVVEMRNAWVGGDFAHIAQSWEQEAGPLLADAAASLSAMVAVLRVQAAEQRRASGDAGSAGAQAVTGRSHVDAVGPSDAAGPSDAIGLQGNPGYGGSLASVGVDLAGIDDVHTEASLASTAGGNDNLQYELAAGAVRASAGASVVVDTHGNVIASAGASAAAYLGYATGSAQAGNDTAHAGARATAYVGAEAVAGASGSIGSGGAKGHLGAEAFAGGSAGVDADATLVGATAVAGAEISYGIGARANLGAELSTTKVGVALDVGAALGVGFGVTFDVSVNPQEVMEAAAALEHALANEPD
ncbi:MAG TPA: hypothetical protein VFF32_12815 [Dermatophilaceae bacterium]|nr:hypothetical protein [Dermatophilaceae bacterium]